MRSKIIILLALVPAILASQNQNSPGSPQRINTWDVVINEIMADPDPTAGNISYPEYVELYNKKKLPVQIKNWKFCVGATCKTLPDVSIPADSFLVLVNATGIKNFSAEVNAAGISSFPALTNTGQVLQLLNEAGNIISVISYTDDWYQDEIKKDGGYSLEQMDAENPCAERSNWKASLNNTGGTPGKRNSVTGINKDTKPPELWRVTVVSQQEVEVNFTEALDSALLADVKRYTISDIGQPSSVSLIKPYYKSVILHLGTPLKEAVMYVLTVEGTIMDCVGNQISKNNTARFAIPAPITERDIVINEILFDPREGGVDFVEIYNRSQHVLDLKNLFLCHYDTITTIVSEIEKISSSGYLLFPDEYLVLTENEEAVKKQYQTVHPEAFLNVTDLPALNADEGNICLKTASGIIDHFTYNTKMHFALLKDTKGISLERVYFARASNDATNWHSASSSKGFATPGYKNSQFSENSGAQEPVSVYPEIFSPNEDGINDQVNVFYHFDQPEWSASILIYDCSGRLVRTLVNNELIGTEGAYSWDGINDSREKERTGMYIIYVKLFNLSGMIKQYKKVCVLSGKN